MLPWRRPNLLPFKIIQAIDVSAGYGSKDVLHNISLTVEPGEFVALIGPNGGGKSTFLKVVSGLLRPTSGQMLLDGRPIDKYTLLQRAQKIAYLPQEIRVEFNLTVRQAVLMGRFPHYGLFGRETLEDHAVVDSVLHRTGLLELSNRELDSLSVGQRQRVWLASCLAQSAPILLLDEPTSSLDLGQTWRMLQLICQEQVECPTEPKTIIGVFHDLEAVKKFCSRAVAIKDGIIVADGVPSKLLTDEFISQLYDLSESAQCLPVRN